jgi:predicted nucleic acid-binding protein
MKILVDTCVWSLVLRRKQPDERIRNELGKLILGHRVAMIGPIRQEILTGIPNKSQFQSLQSHLRAFDDVVLLRHHFEMAAELSNNCLVKGVQGSHTDFIICAVAKAEKMAIYTNDQDFARYSKIIGLSLYKVSAT